MCYWYVCVFWLLSSVINIKVIIKLIVICIFYFIKKGVELCLFFFVVSIPGVWGLVFVNVLNGLIYYYFFDMCNCICWV